MKDELSSVARDSVFSRGNRQRAARVHLVQPRRTPRNRRPLTREHRGHERLRIIRIGKPPPDWRLIKCNAERNIPRRCHRSMALQHIGNPLGQTVGSAMSPEQRDHCRSIIGNSNDRRLRAFIIQQRCDGSDQNSGGANTDNRRARREQRARVLERIGEERIGTIHAIRTAMHFCTERLGDAMRGWLAGPRETKDYWVSQGSSPL